MIDRTPECLPTSHSALTLTTPRGDAVYVRHIQAQDTQLLSELYHKLSPESRRLRFMSAAPEPPDDIVQSRARRLAQIDLLNEAALIATVQVSGHDEAIGVARLYHDPNDPGSAEGAIVLRDDYQGLGIGTILFDLLLQVAMVRGLKRLWLVCLAENTGMRRLVQNCGLPYTSAISHGEMMIAIELVGDTEAESALLV